MKAQKYLDLVKEAREQGINKYTVRSIIPKMDNVLIMRRLKDDFMGGIYEFPGGKVENGKRLDEALFREVKEETGLDVKNIELYLGYYDFTHRNGGRGRKFNFLASVVSTSNIILTEHDHHIWVNRNKASNYKMARNDLKILDNYNSEFYKNF